MSSLFQKKLSKLKEKWEVPHEFIQREAIQKLIQLTEESRGSHTELDICREALRGAIVSGSACVSSECCEGLASLAIRGVVSPTDALNDFLGAASAANTPRYAEQPLVSAIFSLLQHNVQTSQLTNKASGNEVSILGPSDYLTSLIASRPSIWPLLMQHLSLILRHDTKPLKQSFLFSLIPFFLKTLTFPLNRGIKISLHSNLLDLASFYATSDPNKFNAILLVVIGAIPLQPLDESVDFGDVVDGLFAVLEVVEESISLWQNDNMIEKSKQRVGDYVLNCDPILVRFLCLVFSRALNGLVQARAKSWSLLPFISVLFRIMSLFNSYGLPGSLLWTSVQQGAGWSILLHLLWDCEIKSEQIEILLLLQESLKQVADSWSQIKHDSTLLFTIRSSLNLIDAPLLRLSQSNDPRILSATSEIRTATTAFLSVVNKSINEIASGPGIGITVGESPMNRVNKELMAVVGDDKFPLLTPYQVSIQYLNSILGSDFDSDATLFQDWFKVPNQATSLSILILISFLNHPSGHVQSKVLDCLPLAATQQPLQMLRCLPMLLSFLKPTVQPVVQLKVLWTLPYLAKHDACVGPVERTILQFFQFEPLQPLCLRLLCKLFEIQKKTFSKLQAAMSRFNERSALPVRIAQMACVKDVCELDPDLGCELVTVIQQGLRDAHEGVVVLAVQAMTALCAADLMDFFTAWKILKKKYVHLLNDETHPQIQMAVVQLLAHGADDAASQERPVWEDLLERVWKYAETKLTNQNIQNNQNNDINNDINDQINDQEGSMWSGVRTVAYKTLCRYMELQLTKGIISEEEDEELKKKYLTQSGTSDNTSESNLAYLRALKEVELGRRSEVIQRLWNLVQLESNQSAMKALESVLAVVMEMESRDLGRGKGVSQKNSVSASYKLISNIPSLLRTTLNHDSDNPVLCESIALSLLLTFDKETVKGNVPMPRRRKIEYATIGQNLYSDLIFDVNPRDSISRLISIVGWSRFMKNYVHTLVQAEIAQASLKGSDISEMDANHAIFERVFSECSSEYRSKINDPIRSVNILLSLGSLSLCFPNSRMGIGGRVVDEILRLNQDSSQHSEWNIYGMVTALALCVGALHVTDTERLLNIFNLIQKLIQESESELVRCGSYFAIGLYAQALSNQGDSTGDRTGPHGYGELTRRLFRESIQVLIEVIAILPSTVGADILFTENRFTCDPTFGEQLSESEISSALLGLCMASSAAESMLEQTFIKNMTQLLNQVMAVTIQDATTANGFTGSQNFRRIFGSIVLGLSFYAPLSMPALRSEEIVRNSIQPVTEIVQQNFQTVPTVGILTFPFLLSNGYRNGIGSLDTVQTALQSYLSWFKAEQAESVQASILFSLVGFLSVSPILNLIPSRSRPIKHILDDATAYRSVESVVNQLKSNLQPDADPKVLRATSLSLALLYAEYKQLLTVREEQPDTIGSFVSTGFSARVGDRISEHFLLSKTLLTLDISANTTNHPSALVVSTLCSALSAVCSAVNLPDLQMASVIQQIMNRGYSVACERESFNLAVRMMKSDSSMVALLASWVEPSHFLAVGSEMKREILKRLSAVLSYFAVSRCVVLLGDYAKLLFYRKEYSGNLLKEDLLSLQLLYLDSLLAVQVSDKTTASLLQEIHILLLNRIYPQINNPIPHAAASDSNRYLDLHLSDLTLLNRFISCLADVSKPLLEEALAVGESDGDVETVEKKVITKSLMIQRGILPVSASKDGRSWCVNRLNPESAANRLLIWVASGIRKADGKETRTQILDLMNLLSLKPIRPLTVSRLLSMSLAAAVAPDFDMIFTRTNSCLNRLIPPTIADAIESSIDSSLNTTAPHRELVFGSELDSLLSHLLLRCVTAREFADSVDSMIHKLGSVLNGPHQKELQPFLLPLTWSLSHLPILKQASVWSLVLAITSSELNQIGS